MLGSPEDDHEEFWDNVLKHQDEFWKKNNITMPTTEEMEVFHVGLFISLSNQLLILEASDFSLSFQYRFWPEQNVKPDFQDQPTKMITS